MIRIKPQLQSSQKRVARFRKSVRFWASLVCIAGVILHTGIISLNYFMHPLGASLEMKTINTFVLPSVSVCYDYLRSDLKFKKHSNYPIRESSLTVKQINDRLIKWEDLIVFCKVLDSDYNQVDCGSLMVDYQDNNGTKQNPVVLEQLSHVSKCFTLFSKLNSTISYDRANVGDSPLIDFRLNTSNLSLGKRLSLVIMAPFEELVDSVINPSLVQFDASDSNQATVTFESTFVYQFKSKFYRNCFPYAAEGQQKYGCRSVQACINQCVTEAIYNKTGTSFYRRFIKITDRYSNARFSTIADSEFYRTCAIKYPIQPCLIHRYKPLLTSQYKSPYRKSDVFQISVLYPESIDVIIRYDLTHSLTEYLIFLLSTVGLWTELSLNKIINLFLLSTYSHYKQTCFGLKRITSLLAVKLRPGIKTKAKSRNKLDLLSGSRLDTKFAKSGIKPHAKYDTKPDNSTGVNLGIVKPVGGQVTIKKLLYIKRIKQ